MSLAKLFTASCARKQHLRLRILYTRRLCAKCRAVSCWRHQAQLPAASIVPARRFFELAIAWHDLLMRSAAWASSLRCWVVGAISEWTAIPLSAPSCAFHCTLKHAHGTCVLASD
eukprot:scaffold467606_cov18-Prasinocladus_malaysianus.AAC.1